MSPRTNESAPEGEPDEVTTAGPQPPHDASEPEPEPEAELPVAEDHLPEAEPEAEPLVLEDHVPAVGNSRPWPTNASPPSGGCPPRHVAGGRPNSDSAPPHWPSRSPPGP